jgi:Flp pilus assembly protein TadD
VATLEPSRLGLTRGRGDAADRWLRKGERYYFARDWPRATQAFQRARALLPKHPAPLVGLSLVELRRRGLSFEYASAKSDPRVQSLLERLVEFPSDETFAPRWFLCGRLALMLGDGQRALAWLERAQGSAPSADTEGALGIAYLSLGRSREAVVRLRRATELEPDQAAHWTNLGAALMMQESPEQAREAYRRAVELDPNDARALSDLGTTLIALGQARAALDYLERAQSLAPERATVMNNLGFALQSLGQTDRAVEWYERAIACDRTLGSAWLNLGVARAKQGRLDEAESALRRALELDPEDPRALANLEDLDRVRGAADDGP